MLHINSGLWRSALPVEYRPIGTQKCGLIGRTSVVVWKGVLSRFNTSNVSITNAVNSSLGLQNLIKRGQSHLLWKIVGSNEQYIKNLTTTNTKLPILFITKRKCFFSYFNVSPEFISQFSGRGLTMFHFGETPVWCCSRILFASSRLCSKT